MLVVLLAVVPAASAEPPLAPINIDAPTLSGSERLTEPLVVDPGTWDGAEPMQFAFQWRRCDRTGSACGDVASATSTSYVVGDSDLGATLRAVVTATNDGGSTSSVTTASGVIGATPMIEAGAAPSRWFASGAATWTAEAVAGFGVASVSWTGPGG
ncbi:MAG TPA: hypothetical protein VNT03_15950, partial [Baekduia sp.]|nr:hypothetical protein [Baekduia sp.]